MRPHHLMQAGFSALLLALIVVLETKSAIGAFKSMSEPIAAWQHAALSAVCAVIAFFGYGLAGRLKDDERGFVRARALFARCVALAFLLVPIGYLGSSLKADRAAAQWQAYYGSPAYLADVAAAGDPLTERWERRAAAARIVAPSTPDLSVLDGEYWLAAFFQFSLIFASDAFRVPAPVTAEERERQRRSDAAKKAAATRKARAKAKADKKRFSVLAGGRAD